MKFRIFLLPVCVLAFSPAVLAQSGGKRVKVGGLPLKQPAIRMQRRSDSRVPPSRETRPSTDAQSASNDSGTTPDKRTSAQRRLRDNEMTLAQTRVEFARQQMSELESYNLWNRASAQAPLSARVLPYSVSYSPVRLSEPVKRFTPRSTFAHVLVAAQQELTEANLKLDALVAQRDREDAEDALPTADQAQPPVDQATRTAEIEASLRVERFMAKSAEVRLAQLANFSLQTYSGIHGNLYRKLELERVERFMAGATGPGSTLSGQTLSNLNRQTYSGIYRNLYRKVELERQEHELAASAMEEELSQLESNATAR